MRARYGLLVMVLGMAILVVQVEAKEKTVTLTYDNNDILIKEDGTGNDIIYLKGSRKEVGEPGIPAIPSDKINILVDYGVESKDITVTVLDMKVNELDGEYNIPQCVAFQMQKDGEEPKAIKVDPGKDESIYSSSNAWPTNVVELEMVAKNSRTSMAVVRVDPIRYYPKTEALDFVRVLKLKLTYPEPRESVLTCKNTLLSELFPDIFAEVEESYQQIPVEEKRGYLNALEAKVVNTEDIIR